MVRRYLLLAVLCHFFAGISARPSPVSRRGATCCSLPGLGDDFEAAEPEAVNLDPDIVNEALAYANTHGRLSVQIFRHNCRVGAGLLDPLTDGIPNNVWSSTKSVVSILTGIAADKGKLHVDDPIGDYLPSGPGWGDEAHRAITIRNLLSQSAGLDEAILAEAATLILDQSASQEALAQPLKYPPGTHFEYSQRVPDLLAFVVQQAVGEDLQDFAQANLFDPLGIPSDSYFWLRDRSGNTYGYALLFIPPTQFAKLGLLLQNNGSWNEQAVVSASWVESLAQSTPTNPCYGWLFWTNHGAPCTGANLPSAQTYQRHLIPSAPEDLFAMVGFLQQNNFIIPSLEMTVTWTGVLGDTELNLAALLSAAPAADLYYNFFRILMRAVKDVSIPDPGPWQVDPLELDINPWNYANPEVLLNDIAGNPECNIVFCNGAVPVEGLVENLRAIAETILGLLPI
ncbi:hypothetical protein DV738_g4736, partial [Chaetothyriales sp. CBS 135597]